MTRRMLIDATHPEETRVTVVDGNRLEEFDYETTTKKQLKGNIYLAKVTRVEPSLQAAFVEYGGNRHGFLAFSEIHPDYYRIPVADREDLVEDTPDTNGDDDDENGGDESGGDAAQTGPNGEPVEDMGGDEAVDEAAERSAKRRPRLRRHYKIQEVIKRRQVMLVQVVKEERGNKGAALTTYLSLAGRYCVVMPNTSRGGGVSRKISNPADRKRLKTVLADLDVPDGMAVILRTAGAERSKAEIKRDFEYITKVWDDIRSTTLASTAPALIHEEGNLVKRSIRDLYTKDIDEILVSGDDAYKLAKNFMKALIPSHAKKVQPYKDDQGIPLFQRYQVEQQLVQIHDPMVQLRSGGSIVLHQTEALVAIDVNSGRATRERHIEETALKTNLEAAEEVARQLRLRDMAGLVVIDFIDMEENRNAHAVERKLKEALRRDRARIQVGRISAFGLLEMSRQRLRPSLIETMSQSCPTCGGVGYIVSTETAALIVLRAIEEEGLRRRAVAVTVTVPGTVALYLLNNKRSTVSEIEENYDLDISIEVADGMLPPNYEMTRTADDGSEIADDAGERDNQQRDSRRRGRGGRDRDRDRDRGSSRRRGRDRGRDDDEDVREEAGDDTDNTANNTDSGNDNGADKSGGKRRRRGRRRRRYEEDDTPENENNTDATDEDDADDEDGDQDGDREGGDGDDGDAQRGKRRRKRGRRGGRRRGRNRDDDGNDTSETDTSPDSDDASDSGAEEGGSEGTSGAEHAAEGANDDTPDTDQAVAQDGSSTASVAEQADEQVDAPVGDEAPKRGRKKASAKKSPRKKAAAKKSRARKAKAKEPEAAEAAETAETTGSADEGTSAEPARNDDTSGPVEPSPTPVGDDTQAQEPAREETPAKSSVELDVKTEPDPGKPKRRGWWSRVVGQ